MDIQLKRGLLDICVLAAIKDEDSYGYRIIKDMKPYVEISESTLYPILRRLETAEVLVTALDRGDLDWREFVNPNSDYNRNTDTKTQKRFFQSCFWV
jgi:DNA-binding PadR family transcriptional regulator